MIVLMISPSYFLILLFRELAIYHLNTNGDYFACVFK